MNYTFWGKPRTFTTFTTQATPTFQTLVTNMTCFTPLLLTSTIDVTSAGLPRIICHANNDRDRHLSIVNLAIHRSSTVVQ